MNPGPEPSEQDVATASPSAEPQTDATATSGDAKSGPSWLLLIGIALVVMVLVRGFLVQSFYVPSGSMERTIEPGDRILVNKLIGAESIERGDVVVFDGSTSWAVNDRSPHQDDGFIGKTLGSLAKALGIDVGEQDFVKRVIGLPGDRVLCCDSSGRLTVNGVAVDEPYIFPGDKPSESTFDITVPANRLWVMGDHRSDSADSRAHLGSPGGGTVRVDDVIGRAAVTYWPLSRAGGFDHPAQLAGIPRASTP